MLGITKSNSKGWYAVAILCLLFGVSYVDRYILALLADPVATDLNLSDAQMGVVLGFGFALLYCVIGVPVAFLLDRYDRIRIISVGVLFWSIATVASAFAHDYWTLLFWRAGVAAGEAVLLPGGVSLIADFFAKDDRARPTAFFTATAPLMAGGAFIFGGFALTAARFLHASGVDFDVWRITLVLVGAPGALAALLLYNTVRDPGRGADVKPPLGDSAGEISNPLLLRHIWSNIGFYGCFWMGLGLGSAIAVAVVSWTPTLLMRGYGMEMSSAGYAFGLVILPSGFLGTFLWSEIASRLSGRGLSAGPVYSFILGCFVLMVFPACIALAPTSGVLLILAMLTMFGSGSLLVLPAMCVHLAVPVNMRARVTALNVFASNILGMTLGPLVVAVLAQHWPENPRALGFGIAWFSVTAGLLACLFLWLSRPAFRRMMHQDVPAHSVVLNAAE